MKDTIETEGSQKGMDIANIHTFYTMYEIMKNKFFSPQATWYCLQKKKEEERKFDLGINFRTPKA